MIICNVLKQISTDYKDIQASFSLWQRVLQIELRVTLPPMVNCRVIGSFST